MLHVSVLFALLTISQPDDPERLAVMPLQAKRIAPEMVRILDSLLVSELDDAGTYAVIGTEEIDAMLGLEEMKDALGCDDASCAAEIGGALGVGYLVTGTVSRLGDEVIVQLSLVDVRSVRVVGRGKAVVPNDETRFRGAIEAAVAAVLGQEPGAAHERTSSEPSETGPTSPARLRFETQEREREFDVRVVTSTGITHPCRRPVSLEFPCNLGELAPGDGILMVRSDPLSPFSRSLDVEEEDELYVYRLIQGPSPGSVISWTFGGLGLATGAALVGVGYGTDRASMRNAGFITAVVGGGLLFLGMLFEGDVHVDYPEWWR